MSTSVSPFGQPSIFGQTGNAHTGAFGFQEKPPLFGAAPASGTKTTSVFDAFGQSSNSPSILGQTSNANTSAFGFQEKPPLFGVAPASRTNTTSVFGAFGESSKSPSVFGQTSNRNTSAFGFEEKPTLFGVAPTSGINTASLFGAFGQPTPIFGQTSNVNTSAFSFQKKPPVFDSTVASGKNTTPVYRGGQNTIPSFGTRCFDQSKGSRRVAYNATRVTDDVFGPCYLQSISAMPAYSGKSHEELRFEDYSAGDRGGIANGFSSFSTMPNPFSPRTISSSFPPQTATSFGSFPPKTAPSFGLFPPRTAPSFRSFPPQTAPSFSSFPPQTAPSLSSFPPQTFPSFSSLPPQTASNSSSSQASSGWFPPQTCYEFSTNTFFGPFSDQICSSFAPPQTPANPFRPLPSISQLGPETSSYPPQSRTSFNGFLNQSFPFPLSPKIPATTSADEAPLFTFTRPVAPKTSSTSSLNPSPELDSFPNVDWSNSTYYVSTSNPSFSVRDPFLSSHSSHSTPTVQTTNLQSSADVIGLNTSSQGPAPRSTVVDQPVVSSIPFEELPAMARLNISQPGSTISVQFGISSMPVPNSVRASTSVPGKNPRACVVLSAELLPLKSETEDVAEGANTSLRKDEYGVSSQNNTKKEPVLDINLTMSAPETKIYHERREKIKALMPQLSLPDYYTEPTIKQLGEKEMTVPGFCSRVKDFEIGRYGYGNIKFLGETDVRRLCLDSLIEFNYRKIAVYKNEKEKPVVGKGFNKQAVITLINLQCIDKKTGKKYVDGPEVEKYKEMLIKKGKEQGAEFISYDPVNGEWKFRVPHF